jgi:integrase
VARAARGKGEGSVYKSGGRWVAQVEAGRTSTGRRRYARATRRTKPEAIAALRDLQRQIAGGVAADRTLTVAAYLDRWVDEVLPYSGVAQSTVDKYRWVVGHWLKPHIGTVRLDRLTPAHVQTMLRNLEKAGKSARTRAQARTVLRRALGHAQRTELVTRNPAALAVAPRLTRGTSDALTADEAAMVLSAASGDRLEALAVLALRLGMRRGELLALDWSDIDLKRGELTVRAGKTEGSSRTLPLVAGTADVLRSRRGVGPIFTTEAGRRLGGRQALRVWHRWTEAAGLGRRRFHASRHTAATLMLQRGVPLEVVSAILGHASLAITSDIYAKVGMDAKRAALTALDGA